MAASLAHRMAAFSERITADAIEANEFPQLSQHYHVRGVPRIIINERVQVEGAQPEPVFLEYVLRAAEQEKMEAPG
jgi:predicted DsbA family dithiol-disulfide isomerase